MYTKLELIFWTVGDKSHPVDFSQLPPEMRINKFPSTAALSRKDQMWNNYKGCLNIKTTVGPKVEKIILASQESICCKNNILFETYFTLFLVKSDLATSACNVCNVRSSSIDDGVTLARKISGQLDRGCRRSLARNILPSFPRLTTFLRTSSCSAGR